MRVQIDTGVPIAFGILTVRDIADAESRSVPGPGNKGREAAHAAVMTALTLKAIG
jgi:6,7-dimethyl-8-ribityllumazine synthase